MYSVYMLTFSLGQVTGLLLFAQYLEPLNSALLTHFLYIICITDFTFSLLAANVLALAMSADHDQPAHL